MAKVELIFAAIVALGVSTAEAATYDWSGSCPATCIDNVARGTLVMADGYTPDQEITLANFVSFQITEPGDTIGFNYTFRNPASVSGKLAEGRLFITEKPLGSYFEQLGDGAFFFTYGPDPEDYTFIGDKGAFEENTGVSPIPLPTALPLLAIALSGFGFMRRRNRN